MLLIVTGKNNHRSEVICDDSWHNPDGPRDWPNMTLTTEVSQKDKLTDLRGNYLRISVLEALPLTQINGSNVSGYFVDVLDILADLMHFQVVYQRPPDGLWGSKNDDGTWNGMVGELTNNQSDISIGGLSITEDRSQVIDFTYPLIDDDVTLNYRVLEPAELNFHAFFQVFQTGTWISIGVAFILVVIGLCLTSQMGPNKFGILRSCEITWVNFILRDPNGHDHFADTSSLFSYKIWFAIMSLFSLIVMTVYTGDLTSKMTASGPVDDLTSFQDIIDRKWQLLLQPGTNVYGQVARSIEGSALKNVFQNHMFDNDLNLTLAETLLSNRNVVYIGTKGIFIFQPNIRSVKVPGTWSESIAFGVPKDWPHLRTMNYHIQRLREFGILTILKSKWFNAQTSNSIGSLNESFSISYQHTLLPFILLMLVCGLSIFLGILERILPRRTTQLSQTCEHKSNT
ncbi:probable glutamate receptor [Tigriopus californicus]|uniref:probable glutamate receptor n=1 Tax=Tigriopus californicus TaxID=6832 RepID=UPI0027DA1003|nr:probable glutamate receptor [Tigriopus californicus]